MDEGITARRAGQIRDCYAMCRVFGYQQRKDFGLSPTEEIYPSIQGAEKRERWNSFY